MKKQISQIFIFNNSKFLEKIVALISLKDAGYLWDKENYYVKNHAKAIDTLAHIVRMNKTVDVVN